MPDFEILEHTADIGIRCHGASLEEVFVAAALALQAVSLHSPQLQPTACYPMSATGEDMEALLVNWLNEAIYLLDGRRVGLARIAVTALDEFNIQAEGWGEALDPEWHHVQLVVKAATYHQLRIIREAAGWMAEVFLDI